MADNMANIDILSKKSDDGKQRGQDYFDSERKDYDDNLDSCAKDVNICLTRLDQCSNALQMVGGDMAHTHK